MLLDKYRKRTRQNQGGEVYAKLFRGKVQEVYEERKTTFDHTLTKGERLNLTRKIANELWEQADQDETEEARMVVEELEKRRVARAQKDMVDEDIKMEDDTVDQR